MSTTIPPGDPLVPRGSSLSGLTESEAKEFHFIFMISFIAFVAVALFAHLMVWFLWRPWIPGPNGYTSMLLTHANLAMVQAHPALTQIAAAIT